MGRLLDGRHLRLEPLEPRHFDALYQWAISGVIPWNWHGRPLGFEGFRESVWINVIAGFAIVQKETNQPIGYVSAYNANLHHQHCYLMMGISPDVRAAGWPMEAGLLMLRYLFDRFTFRKVYGEVTEGNERQFSSAFGKAVQVEGRLTEHVFVDGHFRDVFLVAISRASYETHIRRAAERLSPLDQP